jgi:NADH dehydrogenase FAD-containing subunit
MILAKLKEKNIEVLYNCNVKDITSEGVELTDGRFVETNAPVWATGA